MSFSYNQIGCVNYTREWRKVYHSNGPMAKCERIMMVLLAQNAHSFGILKNIVVTFSFFRKNLLSLLSLLTHFVFFCVHKDNGIYLRIPSSSYYDIHYEFQMKTHLVSYPFSFSFSFSFHNGNAFDSSFFFSFCFHIHLFWSVILSMLSTSK